MEITPGHTEEFYQMCPGWYGVSQYTHFGTADLEPEVFLHALVAASSNSFDRGDILNTGKRMKVGNSSAIS